MNNFPQNPNQNSNEEALKQQVLQSNTPLPETILAISEQRAIVEGAVGEGIDWALSQHAGTVVTDETGKRHLTLSIKQDRGSATAQIVESTGDDGVRTVDLSFAGKKERPNYWRYTDGQAGRRLTPMTMDTTTGQLAPRKASEHYDPHTDREVVWWGKPWVRNFYEGTPKRQTSGGFRRFLGRGAISD